MAAFFCELFSEEIPARLQARGAEDFARLLSEALSALSPTAVRSFSGPRRIAVAADVASSVPETRSTERGPRVSAPEAALQGFLRKYGASRDDARQEGDFWVLERATPALGAGALIASVMPGLLRRFPWPKSMRWGGTSGFTWVRPLRRIVCLLDGAVVPFSLGAGDDDGHGLCAGDETEGHRFMSPGPFAVASVADWEAGLRQRHVIADAAETRRLVAEGIAACTAAADVAIVPDDGLVAEVAGLVEWPVALLGRIDDAFMDLPPEVMQVSMRLNQRYFATRHADGRAAPYFAFVANIAAPDGGAAIVAGNERVLRARFADARHFWDLDRRTGLVDRIAALDGVVFHAALGTQGARVRRLVALAGVVATAIGADAGKAARAALLAKADLTTGMVGEFPELQGVMGGYYARHDGEDDEVAAAVCDHYAPKGPGDPVPVGPISIAVALADKLDQLAGFFAIGEKPTGSGDPYALRRAALGVIRIIRENSLRVDLFKLLDDAIGLILEDGIGREAPLDAGKNNLELATLRTDIWTFIIERLRVQLKSEGARADVIRAVAGAKWQFETRRDLLRIVTLGASVETFLATENGGHLLAAYKRAVNILRIEERKDGPHGGAPNEAALQLPEELALYLALQESAGIGEILRQEFFAAAMSQLANLRGPLDAFFDKVTVNAPEAELRANRLRLLAGVRGAMNQVADFSAIEG